MTAKTVFRKIIDREISADIIYEDETCLAFHDVEPQAPTHFLVIPKKEVRNIDHLTDEDLALAGTLLLRIRDIARQLGLESGYRVITNCGGDAGQSVPHLHFHVLAGKKLSWP
jgi:histidine triad (HIT) family protein